MSQFLGLGNGSDGVGSLSGTDAPIDSSCSGSAGSNSLSATNASFAAGQMILIHQTRGTGVGNWEVNYISSYVAGTITTLNQLDNTYTDSGDSQAQVLVIKQYSALTIGALTCKLWNEDIGGIAWFTCTGKITLTGAFNGNERGYKGGLGNNNSNIYGDTGEGTAGASINNQNAANGSGGGGGKTTGGEKAGGGGHASAGGSPNGGSSSGSADLTNMTFGGGGGGRGMDSPSGNDGKRGGGIIGLFYKELEIDGGSISVSGGDAPSNAAGGAGGSIFLKGVKSVYGTNLITALGGTTGPNGTSASDGRIRIETCSKSGSTNPSASVVEGGFSFCGQAAQII